MGRIQRVGKEVASCELDGKLLLEDEHVVDVVVYSLAEGGQEVRLDLVSSHLFIHESRSLFFVEVPVLVSKFHGSIDVNASFLEQEFISFTHSHEGLIILAPDGSTECGLERRVQLDAPTDRLPVSFESLAEKKLVLHDVALTDEFILSAGKILALEGKHLGVSSFDVEQSATESRPLDGVLEPIDKDLVLWQWLTLQEDVLPRHLYALL